MNNNMHRLQKILLASVIILAVFNVITLLLLWKGRPGEKSSNPKERMLRVEKRLQLSDEQKNAFENLFGQHQRQMQTMAVKTHLYRMQLRDAIEQGDTVGIQTYTDSLGKNMGHRELMTIQHFKELEQICNPQQKKKLRNMLQRQMARLKERPF